MVPAVTPPPVGSPAWSEKSPTLSELWSDESMLDYLAKSEDSMDENYVPKPSSDEDSVPNSPSGVLQDSKPLAFSGSPRVHLLSEDPRLPDGPRPYPWWLHTDWRPPAIYEVGESSHTASGAQEMLPPAQPAHDDALWLHDLNPVPVTDMDQASTMSWASKVSGWGEEDEEKVADETHLPDLVPDHL